MSSQPAVEAGIYRILFFSFIVKVLVGVCLPLTPDEAYYWVWSLKPQLSYFDHPAFVALLNWFGRPFDNILSAVRVPGLLMSHGTLLIWIHLLRPYFHFTQLKWWLILALIWPLTGPGGVIITPDIPLLFFWSLTLLCTQRFLKSPSVQWSFLTGVTLGLGFTSKYTMVLILPVVLAWVWTELFDRRRLCIYLPLGILGAVITSFPVWYWNLTNDMTSFGFQLGHGFSGAFKAKYPIEYIAAQVGLLFPTTIFFAYRGLRNSPIWLVVGGLLPIVFFGFASFFSRSEANWPLVAHPSVLAIAVLGQDKLLPHPWILRTAGLYLILTTLVVLQVFVPWIPKGKTRIKTDIFHEFHEVAKYAKGQDNLYARSYQMASAVSFYNKEMFYKARGMNRVDSFDFFPESDPPQNFRIILEKNETFKRIVRERYKIKSRKQLNDHFDIVSVEKR